MLFRSRWSPEEYVRRADPERIAKDESILHAWQDGGKRYFLIRFLWAHTHILRRLAELLGGRLAEPRTPEIRERMKKELAPWQTQAIVLGGAWQFGRWVFADGTEWGEKLPPRDNFYAGPGLSVPGLLNGEFCALQRGQAFLIEIPLE